MYGDILTAVSQEFSGQRAFRHVSEITRFHRIQASPGYRQAAAYCAARLEEAGLEVETLRFPGDGRTRFWGGVMPGEWSCAGAELRLVRPRSQERLLASFDDNPISLVQRSQATPPGGITADLVALDRADVAEGYEGLDVRGKVVLASGDLDRIRKLAVEDRGAVGIITDHLTESLPVRPAMEIPAARQYHSFWWYGQERRCFGFVVSPREGAALRRLCRQAATGEIDEPPRVWARVDASFRAGTIEVVSARVGSSCEQEILVVAHLCHPQPSANDNASGAGVLLEVARVLGQLTRNGRLTTPARTIRFLLVPEMAGTYAFLASRQGDLDRFVAGINLDMVGQNQHLCGSTLQVERPPRSVPSFAGDLAAEIMEGVAGDVGNLAGTSRFASFRWAVTRFAGGSDHYVLSDPTVNIPTPMLIQWPDRYYHTDHDTLDKVDPAMLQVVGRVTATYAAFIAAAGLREASWLAHRMTSRLPSVLAEATSGLWASPPVSPSTVKRRLEFLRDRCALDLISLFRLAGQEQLGPVVAACAGDMDRFLSIEVAAVDRLVAVLDLAGEEPAIRPAAEQIPRRLVPGPVAARAFVHLLPPELAERWGRINRDPHRRSTLGLHALYWMDGRRTLGQVADLAELETGMRDDDYLACMCEVLKALGFLEISE